MHLECGWKQVGEHAVGRHVGLLTDWPSHGSSKGGLDLKTKGVRAAMTLAQTKTDSDCPQAE